MSTPDPRFPAASPRRSLVDPAVVRDLSALALIVVGGGSLLACLTILGFRWCDTAGYAVLSLAALGAGLALAARRR